MIVESRDSASLKPAELDEFGQLLMAVNLPLDAQLEAQMEQFPLITTANEDGVLAGFLFGSLERIGGTPCILWGLGTVRKSKDATATLKTLTGEYFRRGAISFPDEDVVVATRIANPSLYAVLSKLEGVIPRPGYSPTGEERAWGRWLAKRFNCNGRYDERTFRLKAGKAPEPIFDTTAIKSGGKVATEMVNSLNPVKGEALLTFGWAMAEALAGGTLRG